MGCSFAYWGWADEDIGVQFRARASAGSQSRDPGNISKPSFISVDIMESLDPGSWCQRFRELQAPRGPRAGQRGKSHRATNSEAGERTEISQKRNSKNTSLPAMNELIPIGGEASVLFVGLVKTFTNSVKVGIQLSSIDLPHRIPSEMTLGRNRG